MSEQNASTQQRDANRLAVYQQLCLSYHQIDDFRSKLLALLPFASAAGLSLLLKVEAAKPLLVPIGIFGSVVTFGLFSYEIYGIRKCGELIDAGIKLEKDLGVVGQFRTRPNHLINEPFAAGVIYPAVLASWLFLVLYALNVKAALCIGSIIFFVGFTCMLVWDIFLVLKARSLPQSDLRKNAQDDQSRRSTP
ncbi:MAG: hypothetical protein QOI77_1370 [Blastocatellia bacterium]|jgi:hypothetical protein|nr:hypothetical protein [Blastocatellia bacterium]